MLRRNADTVVPNVEDGPHRPIHVRRHFAADLDPLLGLIIVLDGIGDQVGENFPTCTRSARTVGSRARRRTCA